MRELWRRMWRAAGTHPAFTPLASRLVTVDRWLGKLTGGRIVAVGMAPALLLTTTGRRSGLARTVPLQYVRDGDDFVVIASNWGNQNDPSWAWNLATDPRAQVTLDGHTIPVRAAETTDPDRERLWRSIVGQWPGYERYRQSAPHRRLRIFRLTPGA